MENVNLDGERELDAFDDQALAAGLKRVRAEGGEPRRKGIAGPPGAGKSALFALFDFA